MEKEKPETAIFSARVKIRDMATIARSFDLLQIPYTSNSNLIYAIVSQYADLLREITLEKIGEDPGFDTDREARIFLNINRKVSLSENREQAESLKTALKEKVLHIEEDDEKVNQRAKELRKGK